MNKTYRVVWSQASESWVAAAENARTKSKRGRTNAAVLAVFALAAGSAQAGSGYSVGVLSDGYTPASCLSDQGAGVVQTSTVACDGTNHPGAGLVAYTTSGGMGAYAVAVDPNTLVMGAGGATLMTMTAGTVSIGAGTMFDMGYNKVQNMAPGALTAGSRDGVTGVQLYLALSTTASSLGGGASMSGASISPPSYPVAGTTYHDVGGARDCQQFCV